jgi:hypothetical protein
VQGTLLSALSRTGLYACVQVGLLFLPVDRPVCVRAGGTTFSARRHVCVRAYRWTTFSARRQACVRAYRWDYFFCPETGLCACVQVGLLSLPGDRPVCVRACRTTLMISSHPVPYRPDRICDIASLHFANYLNFFRFYVKSLRSCLVDLMEVYGCLTRELALDCFL